MMLRAASGPRGALRVAEVLGRARLQGRGEAPRPVGVPMRVLGGGSLHLRPGTSDLSNATSYYSLGLHRPPPQMAGELGVICELGSNMGAALAALAHENPSARLLGVEPDPANIEIATRNVAPYGDRCVLVRSAIWEESAELVVDSAAGRGEHGLTVRPRRDDDPPGTIGIEARTIDELLDENLPAVAIDYMHVTIEGTEPRAFAAAVDWPERVRSLRVELHPYYGYDAEACIRQLQAMGYVAWPDPALPDKWVFALRP